MYGRSRVRLGQSTMFSYVEERFESPELDLSYHLAPWDQPIFQTNTATISSIRVGLEDSAPRAFRVFQDWCIQNDVKLVSCRLPQDRLTECAFLERQGFRFIELNYRPTIVGLGDFYADAEICVRPAIPSDATDVCAIAAQVFKAGRLHVDPQIGPELGNRRYAVWAANAFQHPKQHVLKCLKDGRIIAFVVVERPTCASRFWSLIGLAPGLAGQGMGRRVWRSILAFHHLEGVQEVSTSISSHNVAIHNLYVSLQFRFPAPTITLHWCPLGPVRVSA
jgi:hypothetical protein